MYSLFLPLLLAAEPADLHVQAIDKINAYRRLGGLPPVKADPTLSKGCQAHADYLLKNFDAALAGKINVHDEDQKLPSFTAEGRQAAHAAVISQMRGPRDPLLGIDLWMASFYHRVPLLDPNLSRVGIGFAHQGETEWFAVIDVKSGKVRPKETTVVRYPTDGQKGIPLVFALGAPEMPNPIPANGSSRAAGHPITVSFFAPRPTVTAATARLIDDSGKEVPSWFSSPEKPAVKGFGSNTICLIPQAPLQPNATYTVDAAARVNGRPWKSRWSFHTGPR